MNEYNPEHSSKELERMFHARLISFNEYHMQHKMIWYTYATFEMEPDHVVNCKTFTPLGDGSYANRLNSLERRQSNDARKEIRRSAFL